MKSIDIILHSGHILTMDKDFTEFQSGSIAIDQGKIIDISSEDLSTTYQAETVIDANDHIVMPGFVNTHAHYAMTLMRGYADDYPLWIWLNDYIWPFENKVTNPDSVVFGTEIGLLEAIRSGTTCFNEHYFHCDVAANAIAKAGMRSMVTVCTAEHMLSDKFWKESIAFIEEYKKHHLITPALGAHGPHSVPEDLLLKTKQVTNDHDIAYHFHLAESIDEVKIIQERAQKTPTKYCYDLDILDQRTLAAHCIHTTDQDIDLLAETKTNVLHNPESNMKLASGWCQVEKMLSKNVLVSLATDGPASNNTLDMFKAMKHASLLSKHMTNDPTSLPARDVVKMATIDGARTLGLDDKIGSLEVGKSADLICLDLIKPHLQPCYNPYATLVYAAQGADVNHMIVDGKMVMQNQNILTMDEEKILHKAKAFSKEHSAQ